MAASPPARAADTPCAWRRRHVWRWRHTTHARGSLRCRDFDGTALALPRMTRAGALVVLTLLAPVSVAVAGDDERGWKYLVDRLVADGVPRTRVTAVFSDPRMEPFTGVQFSMGGKEPRRLYRAFFRPSTVAAARRCRDENAASLTAAERTYGVPASVVTAILFVETSCGRNTGSSPMLYRLARLAMANEPANVADNIERFARHGDVDPRVERRVRARARELETTFYPEVRAAFEVADRMGVHPLTLRGSASGAIGFPQFLPTSYLKYGADAGGDGRVDLFDAADAAASCANYLAGNGWRPGPSAAGPRAALWRAHPPAPHTDPRPPLPPATAPPAPAPKTPPGPTVQGAA